MEHEAYVIAEATLSCVCLARERVCGESDEREWRE